jgi:hypothetical protein
MRAGRRGTRTRRSFPACSRSSFSCCFLVLVFFFSFCLFLGVVFSLPWFFFTSFFSTSFFGLTFGFYWILFLLAEGRHII